MAAVLFIQDSVILFFRGKNNRPRRMLGVTTMVWGVMYICLFFGSYYGKITFPVLSGDSLLSSHIFICIMFLFPLEVLLPGWLNFKRTVLMLTPIATLSAIYFLGLVVTGQSIEEFFSFSELIHSVGRFNVWFRFVVLFCNLLFIYLLMQLLDKNERIYIYWQNMNFSDQENVDIRWLSYYKNMIRVIFACYLFVAVWGSILSIIVHTVAVIIGFTTLFYKGLFYENTFREDFSEFSKKEEPKILGGSEVKVEDAILTTDTADRSFETKLPVYVAQLKQWMEAEQPYLYKDFKLIDVTRVLPLNRSYLSRVFNEGFHRNFSEVVRGYRIEHAKKIMVEHPDFTLYKVAELCGFSSDTTFFRAFQSVTGKTPKAFKQEIN